MTPIVWCSDPCENNMFISALILVLSEKTGNSTFLYECVYTLYCIYALVPTLCLFTPLPNPLPSFFSRSEESDAEVLHFCLCWSPSEVQLGKSATLVLKQRAV